MQKPLISVIIPVYNVEVYLERCVESVRRQTYNNLEILLIDDGSTDGSGNLCDGLQGRDERIRVIHQPNGGLSAARNAGIQHCCGEFIAFLDSDDFICENHVELLFDNLEEEQADIAIGILKVTESDTIPAIASYSKKQIWDGLAATEYLLYQKCFSTSACAKLYHRSLWNDIAFPEGKLFEDTVTLPYVFAKAKKIVWINAEIYGYFKRPGSITKTSFHNRMMDYESGIAKLMDELGVKYPRIQTALLSRYVWANVYLWIQMPSEGFEPERGIVETNIRTYRGKVLLDPKVALKNRIVILLTYLGHKNIKKIYQWMNGHG